MIAIKGIYVGLYEYSMITVYGVIRVNLTL